MDTNQYIKEILIKYSIMISVDDIEDMRFTRVGLCFASAILFTFTGYVYHSLSGGHDKNIYFNHTEELLCRIPS